MESGILKFTAIKTTIGLGCAMVTMVIVALLTRTSFEDEALHQFAGKEWEEWIEKVPYKLIPLIY